MRRWETFQDLLRSRSAAFGMGLIALVLLVATIGPAIAPYDPLKPAPLDRLKGPSAEHLFGTDSLGRDIFSRVIYGARISILIGLISVSISLLPGTLLGLLAGYFGGRVDSLIMRLMDKASALAPQVKTASCINCPTVKVLGSPAFRKNSVCLIRLLMVVVSHRWQDRFSRHHAVR